MLWSNSSGWYVAESQTASLSEPVSSQPRGIVLHWQGYIPGEGVQDYQHQYVFVSKRHVTNFSGQGVAMLMSADTKLVVKYVYVNNNQVIGNAKNATPDHTISGMTIDNRYLALTEVLGV